jgi:hypothetical protein
MSLSQPRGGVSIERFLNVRWRASRCPYRQGRATPSTAAGRWSGRPAPCMTPADRGRCSRHREQAERQVVEQPRVADVGVAVDQHEEAREACEQERHEADEAEREAGRGEALRPTRPPQSQPDAGAEHEPERHRRRAKEHPNQQRRPVPLDRVDDLRREAVVAGASKRSTIRLPATPSAQPRRPAAPASLSDAMVVRSNARAVISVAMCRTSARCQGHAPADDSPCRLPRGNRRAAAGRLGSPRWRR